MKFFHLIDISFWFDKYAEILTMCAFIESCVMKNVVVDWLRCFIEYRLVLRSQQNK